jgi:N6-adenosine-specific RNA methylase IME4
MKPLARYDIACRALAEAKRVDEVKEILNVAAATKEYARRAKNRQMEEDAVEIRMRAARRLDELIKAQKQTVGLAQGTRGSRMKGARVDDKPTLAEAGIDKNLAQQARVLGAMDDEAFESKVAEARTSVSQAYRRVVNAVAIEQEREQYRNRTYQGGTVANLNALAANGFRAGVIAADPPWTFKTYSGKGKQRSAERHYDCMTLDEIKALPVAALAAANCALFIWSVHAKQAIEVIEAWGFEYKKEGFIWVKTKQSAECVMLDGTGLDPSMGYSTRNCAEVCYLGIKGEPPLRLAADVRQVVLAPTGEHSKKPDEVYRRIERLYPGPYLELFARKPREGWMTWGNEVAPPMKQKMALSINHGGDHDQHSARSG